MLKTLIRAILLAGLVALGGPALAQPLVPGKDYRVLQPAQPVDNPKRVEVIEFFWYGCPHCADLQPALKAWMKQKSPDIELRRVPAVFRESWIPHTRLFYTLEAMGQVDRLHDEVFKAIHEQKVDLGDLARMQAWVAKRGVDPKKFAEVYGSFGIDSRVQRSIQMSKAYQLSGTPSLVVHGRYLTSPAMTQGFERTFAVVEQLAAQVRSGNAPAK
ncbi:MAG: thiol:disulfide interchange protein DsbA/DsbL [bacterium]|jgi:thiol:disulfide interchange protein DsbA|nr:thiol:disulfide interchange protein DsbA/DsbL [Betaproteobacteria bacterium]